jgi:hypothetical protein
MNENILLTYIYSFMQKIFLQLCGRIFLIGFSSSLVSFLGANYPNEPNTLQSPTTATYYHSELESSVTFFSEPIENNETCCFG